MRPLCAPVNAGRCRTSVQKGGGAPSTSTPLVRRTDAPGEDGARGAQPSLRFVEEEAGNPC